jgi:prolyl-tRNA editing enzyme YbaK/EbsC (Cys-tRNA(Pro) deacylase)
MSEQSSEHAAIARFREELSARGGTGRIVVLPDSVHTAKLAAEALGCEVGAIANSLLFTVTNDEGDQPLLLLTSGAHRVDTAKVAADLGIGSLKRATPEFVRRHTGQVIGGVSPIGHPAPVPTWLDPWLERYDVVWAAAGHPHSVFPTTYDELVRITGGTPADVGAAT